MYDSLAIVIQLPECYLNSRTQIMLRVVFSRRQWLKEVYLEMRTRLQANSRLQAPQLAALRPTDP